MFFSFLITALLAEEDPGFPVWPPSYTLKGTWSVPYTNLSNPITIVTTPSRQYTNKYDGLEIIWKSTKEEHKYRKLIVAQDKQICYGFNKEWTIELTEFLPKPDGYSYIGQYAHLGKTCHVWEKTEATDKPQTWRIYVDVLTGFPVTYYAKAISVYGSHYDIYEINVESFMPDAQPGFFIFPNICNDPNISDDPYPGVGLGSLNTGFDLPKKTQKPVKWTRPLGRRSSIQNPDLECKEYKGTGKFDLPVNFSWREYKNVTVTGPPRDQCACGSCWAFGTAEALEAQFALAYGEFREVSVNQILDCTWEETGNTGCQGGESAPSFRYLQNHKVPIVTEKSYPYIGVTGYCETNYKKEDILGYIDGCIHVEPKTASVKEAIYRFGPASIGINVLESMLMYKGGVYEDEQCQGRTGPTGDLVHEVLLTGWKVIDGRECWEIKNSWSTHWGYEGYIYIQAEHQEWNCGVTTSVMIPSVVLPPKENK